MGINLAIKNKTLGSMPSVVEAMNSAKNKNGRVHFLGLVSGVLHYYYYFGKGREGGEENLGEGLTCLTPPKWLSLVSRSAMGVCTAILST